MSQTSAFSQEFTENLSSSFREWAAKQKRPEKLERPSAKDRRESATKHRGRKSAAEARKQLGEIAPAMTTSRSVIPAASDVDVAVAPNAMRLEGENGKPGGVVVSNMPLVVPPADKDDAKQLKNWKLADLDLRQDGDRYRVSRSYLPISVPSTADGTTKVGDLAARFSPDAADTTGSVNGETITYPNVDTDTDLTLRVSSVSTKAGWTLRSPQAPSLLKVPLQLPDGATAKVIDDHGTVTITDASGKTIGSVSAPSAIDAAKFPVDVKTTVDGDTIEYAVKDEQGETTYPVAVDPIFSRNWEAGATDFSDWTFGRSRPQVPFGGLGLTDPAYGQFRGLEVYGNAGPAITSTSPYGYGSGDWATFARYAPGNQATGTQYGNRKVAADHAYWYRADVGGVDYSFTASQWYHYWPDPNPTFALLPYTGNFPGITQKFTLTTSAGSYGPYDGGMTNFQNNTLGAWGTVWTPGAGDVNDPNGAVNARNVVANRPDNMFVAGLYDYNWYQGNGRPATAVFLGAYNLYASDDYAPTISDPSPAASGAWTDDPSTVPSSVSVTATDNGTGVLTTQLRDSTGTVRSQSPTNSCPVSFNTLCNFTQTSNLTVPAAGEGRTTYTIDATDASGLTASNTLTFTAANRKTLSYGIDTTDPDLTLSGDLFTQRDTEIGTTETRPLTVSAADGVPNGTPAQQQSGIQRVEVYVDHELVHSADQTQTGDSRGLATTWTPPAGTFTAGDYVVRVVTTDRLGHEKDAQFTVHAPCCGNPLTDASVSDGGRLYDFGDVNGDGKSDVVLVTPASGSVSLRLGNGDGTFGTEAAWGTLGGAVSQIALGDIDGDDRADIAASSSSGQLLTAFAGDAAFGLVNPSSTEGLETSWPTNRTLELVDFDGDGFSDAAGVDDGTNRLMFAAGDESGLGTAQALTTIPETRRSLFGDLDGDGMADLVTYEPSDGVVRYHRTDSDADTDDLMVGPTETWDTGPTNADAALGDINGDGIDDLVFRTDGSSSDPVIGKTSSKYGGFTDGSREFGQLDAGFALLTSDITGDGKADILGTRVVAGSLELRSLESSAPNPEEPEPATQQARLTAAAVAPASTAEVMVQDDQALLWKVGDYAGGDVARALQSLKHLGVTKLRVIVGWGSVDRVHPKATVAAAAGNNVTLNTYPGPNGTPTAYPADTLDRAAPDTEPDPGDARRGPTDTVTGKIVQDRWLWKPYDDLLRAASTAGLEVHITLTGGTYYSYLDCNSRLPAEDKTLMPRGCVGVTDGGAEGDPDRYLPTGWNPDPKAYGHFIHEAVKHFRTVKDPAPGKSAALTSIGLWNEPNFTSSGVTPSRYLAVTSVNPGSSALRIKPTDLGLKKPTFITAAGAKTKTRNRNSATRYGQLYAYGYWGSRTADDNVKVLFGETAPSDNSYRDGSKTSRVRANTYIEQALSAADAAWRDAATARSRAGDAGYAPIVDAYAIHPYQHRTRPWDPGGSEVFGTYGVGKKGRSISKPLTDYLADFAEDGIVTEAKTTSTDTAGSPPPIWATEFGYYNYNLAKINPGKVKGKAKPSPLHSEDERTTWLNGSDGRGGAFEQLRVRGGVPVMALYNVFERPPTTLYEGDKDRADDLGIIGSTVTRTMQTGVPSPSTRTYSGQGFQLRDVRPYGFVRTSAGYSLRGTQDRKFACAVRRWVKQRGTSKAKGFANADPGLSGTQRCSG